MERNQLSSPLGGGSFVAASKTTRNNFRRIEPFKREDKRQNLMINLENQTPMAYRDRSSTLLNSALNMVHNSTMPTGPDERTEEVYNRASRHGLDPRA